MWLKRIGLRGVSIAAFAAAIPVALTQPAAASPDAAPQVWTFDKCSVADGVWEGSVVGPTGPGELRTVLTSARQTGSVLHVDFDWHIGDTYTAQLTGTLNLKTGAVVMNGRVSEATMRAAGCTRKASSTVRTSPAPASPEPFR